MLTRSLIFNLVDERKRGEIGKRRFRRLNFNYTYINSNEASKLCICRLNEDRVEKGGSKSGKIEMRTDEFGNFMHPENM
jgi:hypothetical protein